MSPVRRCLDGLLLVVGLLATACQAPASTALTDRAAGVAGDREVTIYVTSNGWHTGIVVARKDLPAEAIPEAADFPQAPYLGFGWGDAEYYPAPRPTLGMALGAALVPSSAVVHLAGLRSRPREALPNDEVLRLKLSAEGFRRLAAYLDAAFDRAGAPRAEAVAPGLYSFSRFYPGTGKFHLFNTCNTWTARALVAAGVPIDAAASLSAEDLMSQLRGWPGAGPAS